MRKMAKIRTLWERLLNFASTYHMRCIPSVRLVLVGEIDASATARECLARATLIAAQMEGAATLMFGAQKQAPEVVRVFELRFASRTETSRQSTRHKARLRDWTSRTALLLITSYDLRGKFQFSTDGQSDATTPLKESVVTGSTLPRSLTSWTVRNSAQAYRLVNTWPRAFRYCIKRTRRQRLLEDCTKSQWSPSMPHRP